MCFYCGALPYNVKCDLGEVHSIVQHNEGACPQWYDVAGLFEEGCSICDRQTFYSNLGFTQADDKELPF